MAIAVVTSSPDQPVMCFVPCDPDRPPVLVSTDLWEAALRLAAFYGWEAEGTAPPTRMYQEIDPETGEDRLEAVYESWSGTYLTRQQQPVTDNDARHLSDALKTALRDVPGEGAPLHPWNGAGALRNRILNWFVPHKAALHVLIAFCSDNDFEIH